MVATGRAAQHGVLFRDAQAIETLRGIDTLVLDKTGTLTEGRPVFGQLAAADDSLDATQLLQLAASVDQGSEHPLARAIVAEARARGLALLPVEDFDSMTGRGARGRVGERTLLIGNRALMEENNVMLPAGVLQRADALRADGASVILLALDGTLAAALSVVDPIKPTSAEAIRALRADGLRIVMASGDAERTARAVATRLGLDEVHADMRPEAKSTLVSRLQQQGRRVAMAGDGINDAPALATADIGIAMGHGTDVAMSSARQLSRATVRNMKQNLGFAFAYNGLGIPVAAGVLMPWGISLSPMLAAVAMSLSSVSVISNALRLRSQRLPGV